MILTLLVILICLGLDYGLEVNSRYRPLYWFNHYEHVVLKWTKQWVNGQPWLIIAALLVPFTVVLFGVQCLSHASRVTYFLFSLVVLWFSLNTFEWRDVVLSQLNHSTKEAKKTDEAIEELIGDDQIEPGALVEQNTLTNKIKNAIFWQAHEQVFAIVFWFIILGPLGAGLYRFIWLMCYRSSSNVIDVVTAAQIEQVHGVAAWIPARVTSLTYCLVGNWHPSWGVWAKNVMRPGFSRNLLVECGNLAIDAETLDDNHKISASLSLVTRALFAWLLIMLLVVVLH